MEAMTTEIARADVGTTLALASAALTLCGGVMALAVSGAAEHSRRTAMLLASAVLALAWMMVAVRMDVASLAVLRGDMGLALIIAGMAALLSVAGLFDRLRPLALLLIAALTGVVVMVQYLPLHPVWLHGLYDIAVVYGVLVVVLLAHAVLAACAPLHPERFTRLGTYRVARERLAMPLAACATLAIGLAIVLWQMSAFEGVHSVFHIYGAMLAAITSAFAAGLVSYVRREPELVHKVVLALPAGVLAMGALGTATPAMVIGCALGVGAAVALVVEALKQLRIDEPSGVTAALLVPAMLGWLAPAIVDVGLLAEHLHALGLWVMVGATLGVVLMLLARMVSGFSCSGRLMQEGMDSKYIAH